MAGLGSINKRKIKSSDQEYLHTELGLVYLINRRRRHVLHMMFNLVKGRPDMLDVRDKGIVLRGSQNVLFKERKLS